MKLWTFLIVVGLTVGIVGAKKKAVCSDDTGTCIADVLRCKGSQIIIEETSYTQTQDETCTAGTCEDVTACCSTDNAVSYGALSQEDQYHLFETCSMEETCTVFRTQTFRPDNKTGVLQANVVFNCEIPPVVDICGTGSTVGLTSGVSHLSFHVASVKEFPAQCSCQISADPGSYVAMTIYDARMYSSVAGTVSAVSLSLGEMSLNCRQDLTRYGCSQFNFDLNYRTGNGGNLTVGLTDVEVENYPDNIQLIMTTTGSGSITCDQSKIVTTTTTTTTTTTAATSTTEPTTTTTVTTPTSPTTTETTPTTVLTTNSSTSQTTPTTETTPTSTDTTPPTTPATTSTTETTTPTSTDTTPSTTPQTTSTTEATSTSTEATPSTTPQTTTTAVPTTPTTTETAPIVTPTSTTDIATTTRTTITTRTTTTQSTKKTTTTGIPVPDGSSSVLPIDQEGGQVGETDDANNAGIPLPLVIGVPIGLLICLIVLVVVLVKCSKREARVGTPKEDISEIKDETGQLPAYSEKNEFDSFNRDGKRSKNGKGGGVTITKTHPVRLLPLRRTMSNPQNYIQAPMEDEKRDGEKHDNARENTFSYLDVPSNRRPNFLPPIQNQLSEKDKERKKKKKRKSKRNKTENPSQANTADDKSGMFNTAQSVSNRREVNNTETWSDKDYQREQGETEVEHGQSNSRVVRFSDNTLTKLSQPPCPLTTHDDPSVSGLLSSVGQDIFSDESDGQILSPRARGKKKTSQLSKMDLHADDRPDESQAPIGRCVTPLPPISSPRRLPELVSPSGSSSSNKYSAFPYGVDSDQRQGNRMPYLSESTLSDSDNDTVLPDIVESSDCPPPPPINSPLSTGNDKAFAELLQLVSEENKAEERMDDRRRPPSPTKPITNSTSNVEDDPIGELMQLVFEDDTIRQISDIPDNRDVEKAPKLKQQRKRRKRRTVTARHDAAAGQLPLPTLTTPGQLPPLIAQGTRAPLHAASGMPAMRPATPMPQSQSWMFRPPLETMDRTRSATPMAIETATSEESGSKDLATLKDRKRRRTYNRSSRLKQAVARHAASGGQSEEVEDGYDRDKATDRGRNNDSGPHTRFLELLV